MTGPLIVVSSLEKTYRTKGRALVRALAGISLDIAEREFVTIVGQSGCGKTTFLKILAGLLTRSAGSVHLRGNAVDGPSRDIGVVFQDPVLLPWRTVFDNVMLPVQVLGLDRTASRRRALSLLELVGLQGFEERYGIATLAQWTTLQNIFKEQKIVQGSVPPADLYTDKLVDQINKFDHQAVIRQAKEYKW